MILRIAVFLLAILTLTACGGNQQAAISTQDAPPFGNGLPTLIFFYTDN